MSNPNIRRIIGLMKKTTGSVTYATWNPSDKGAAITLSGGDLSGSKTSSAGLVRSTIGKSSGKWYWEINNATASAIMGVAYASAPNTDYLSSTPNGWGYYGSTGILYNNSITVHTGATYTTTDVIGYALDASAGTLAVYKNNSLQFTLTGLSGTIYAAGSGDGVLGGSWTANFGATALTYSPPGGFNAGLYV